MNYSNQIYYILNLHYCTSSHFPAVFVRQRKLYYHTEISMSSIIFIFILTNVTATPTASPSETAKPTTSPTAVPISTPNNSYYTDDDSLSDYVTPTRTVYDTFHYLHCGYCLQKSSINHQRNRNIKHYLYKRWGTKWHYLFI